jgi:tRNA dimethylallyltransferase
LENISQNSTVDNSNKKLLTLVGPTGIGKTSLAIELAERLKTEIISADSRQFYKELKIGTATPTAAELSKVKHHLIGNISIQDYYNVYLFENDALQITEQLFQTNNYLIAAGGSGLYIDALCNSIDDIPDVDDKIRNDLAERFEQEGIESLRFDLKRLDPLSYDQVDLRNPKRVLRALEVTLSSGKPYSSFRTSIQKKRPFNIVKIGLNMNREELYKRIDLRVDTMINEGLVDEVKSLLPFRKQNALNTVGYKEIFGYLDGGYSLERAIELIKRNSRRYAKRQLSWFNRDQEIEWFHPGDIDLIEHHVLNFGV